MVIEIIVILIIMVAGCVLLMQLFDFFENEIIRAILIVGYGLLAVGLLFNWFFTHIADSLSNFI